MTDMSVVFPAPLGPSRPRTVPGAMVRESGHSTCREPKERVTRVRLRTAGSRDAMAQPQ